MSGIEIERALNGFEVEYCDPDVEKKNRAAGAKSWMDPKRKMVFMAAKDVVSFLEKHLETLTTSESFDSAFSKAVMEADDESGD
jgi:hypothetical protein